MLNYSTKSIIFAMLFIFVSVSAYAGYGEVKSVEFYKQFTYEWTDWQGVTHTSDITEKATSPEQIIALISKIYGDPAIPGTLTANPDDVPSPTAEEMYNHKIPAGYDYFQTDGETPIQVTPPTEEGMTLLLVKVNDKWTINNIYYEETIGEGENAKTKKVYEPINVHYYEKNHCDANYTGKGTLYMFISEAIQSVQLITSAVRISDDNAPEKSGYVVNIRESLNKFFFMSKGKQREEGYDDQVNYPFGWMFEEFSPTLSSGQSTQTDNVFSYISNGESYNITHICGSVAWQDHQFVLDNANNISHEVNMSFFIPDYRLAYWTADEATSNGWENIANAQGRKWTSEAGTVSTDNTYYHPLYYPKLFVYTVDMTASATKHENAADETGSYCDVTISWDVNIDDVVGGALVDQTFYVYKVVDGIVQSEPVATVTGNERSCTILEERAENTTDVTYIISAQPQGAVDFPAVWSDEATVTIPGTSADNYLSLTLDGNGSCIFDAATQTNYYANPLVLNNGISESKLTWELINNTFTDKTNSYYFASRICFYRINKATGEKTRFATMNLRRLSPTASKYEEFNTDYILYGVPLYENQTLPDLNGDEIADIAYPDATNISGEGGVGYIPGNVLPIVDGVVDFSSLPLLDCFAVSVADNSHAPEYEYKAVFVQYPTSDTQGTATDDTDADASTMYSNKATVSVAKTSSESAYNLHTADFVSADDLQTDLTQLTALNGGVTVAFTVKNNPRILRYVVTRSTDGTAVIIAQRVDDGSYTVFERGNDGYFNLAVGKFTFNSGTSEMTVSAVDDLRDTDASPKDLQYVVTVECKDITTSYGATLDATYGSQTINPSYIDFNLISSSKACLTRNDSQSTYQLGKYGTTSVSFTDFVVDHYNL